MQIQVLFCGGCDSGIHQTKNEWSNPIDPCAPGHEVVGRVTTIGAGVTAHALSDIVGVGGMIDSYRHCQPCKPGERGTPANQRHACTLAEAVRFELTDGFPSPVFKTGAIDHSATLPGSGF